MNEEKIVGAAMSIIISAGDARLYVTEALNAISAGDFALAGQKLKMAQEKMTEAHAVQTEMIQGEARGESIGYSLLFTHAQDTLMTIGSELNLGKQLFKLFEAVDKRLERLEKGE